MPNKNNRALYDMLKKENYDVKSYEEFNKTYGTEKGIATLHNFLGKEGYDVQPLDEFRQIYFSDLPTAQASVEQADQMNNRSNAMAQGNNAGRNNNSGQNNDIPSAKDSASPEDWYLAFHDSRKRVRDNYTSPNNFFNHGGVKISDENNQALADAQRGMNNAMMHGYGVAYIPETREPQLGNKNYTLNPQGQPATTRQMQNQIDNAMFVKSAARFYDPATGKPYVEGLPELSVQDKDLLRRAALESASHPELFDTDELTAVKAQLDKEIERKRAELKPAEQAQRDDLRKKVWSIRGENWIYDDNTKQARRLTEEEEALYKKKMSGEDLYNTNPEYAPEYIRQTQHLKDLSNALGERILIGNRKIMSDAVAQNRREADEFTRANGGDNLNTEYAKKFRYDTEKIIEAPDKYLAERQGFFETLGNHFKGMGDAVTDYENIPIVGSGASLARYGRVARLVHKADGDAEKNLTQDERILLQSFCDYLDAVSRIQLEHAGAYSYGAANIQSMSFMGEMMLFAGAEKLIGKGAAKGAASLFDKLAKMKGITMSDKLKRGLVNATGKTLQGISQFMADVNGAYTFRHAGKEIAVLPKSKGIAKLGENILNAGIEAGTSLKTYSEIEKARSEKLQSYGEDLTTSEIGWIVYDQFAEYFSESGFNTLNKHITDKIVPDHLRKFIDTRGKWTRFTSDKFIDAPSEVLEEYERAMMDIGIGGVFGNKELVEQGKQLFTVEGAKGLAASMWFQTVLMGGATATVASYKQKQLNNKRSELLDELAKNIGSDEAEGLLSVVESSEDFGSFEDKLKVIYSALVRGGMQSDDAVRLVRDYSGLYTEANVYLNQVNERYNKMSPEEKARFRQKLQDSLMDVRETQQEAELIARIEKKYNLSAGGLYEIMGKGSDNLTDTELAAYAEYIEEHARNASTKADIQDMQNTIRERTGADGKITTATVDGQQVYIKNSENGICTFVREDGSKGQTSMDNVTVIRSEDPYSVAEASEQNMRNVAAVTSKHPSGSLVVYNGQLCQILDADSNNPNTTTSVIAQTIDPETGKDTQVNIPIEKLAELDTAFIPDGLEVNGLTFRGLDEAGNVILEDEKGFSTEMSVLNFLEMANSNKVDLVSAINTYLKNNGKNEGEIESETQGGSDVADANHSRSQSLSEEDRRRKDLQTEIEQKYGLNEGELETIATIPAEEQEEHQMAALTEFLQRLAGDTTQPVETSGEKVVAQDETADSREKLNESIKVSLSELGRKYGIHIKFSNEKKKAKDKNGKEGFVEGVFDQENKTITIYVNNLNSVQRAAIVFAHEVFGHYGLSKMFEGHETEKKLVLGAVLAGMTPADRAKYYAIASFNPRWNDMTPEEKNALVADEYIASVAEEYQERKMNGTLDSKFMNKVTYIYEIFKNFLNRILSLGKYTMSRDEVMHLIVSSEFILSEEGSGLAEMRRETAKMYEEIKELTSTEKGKANFEARKKLTEQLNAKLGNLAKNGQINLENDKDSPETNPELAAMVELIREGISLNPNFVEASLEEMKNAIPNAQKTIESRRVTLAKLKEKASTLGLGNMDALRKNATEIKRAETNLRKAEEALDEIQKKYDLFLFALFFNSKEFGENSEMLHNIRRQLSEAVDDVRNVSYTGRHYDAQLREIADRVAEVNDKPEEEKIAYINELNDRINQLKLDISSETDKEKLSELNAELELATFELSLFNPMTNNEIEEAAKTEEKSDRYTPEQKKAIADLKSVWGKNHNWSEGAYNEARVFVRDNADLRDAVEILTHPTAKEARTPLEVAAQILSSGKVRISYNNTNAQGEVDEGGIHKGLLSNTTGNKADYAKFRFGKVFTNEPFSKENGVYTIDAVGEMIEESCNADGIPCEEGSGTNVLLEFLQSVEKPSDINNYVLHNRIDEASAMASELRAQDEEYFATHPEEKFSQPYEVRYSVITDSAKIDELEKGEQVKVYRAMTVDEYENLYGPMSSNGVSGKGKGKVVMPSVRKEQWEQSEEHPEVATYDDKLGYAHVTIKDDAGGSTDVAYNPYIHTSFQMLNDQFAKAWRRPNMVVVECYVPKSELESGYKAEWAKNSVGVIPWLNGVVSKTFTKKPRMVALTRYAKIGGIVPMDEYAKSVKQLLIDNDVLDNGIPFSNVTPQQREALYEIGVPIVEPKGNGKTKAATEAYQEWKKGKEVRYSVTPAEDAEYMAAVESGDMENAQRMVDNVASRLGYTIHAYHGTGRGDRVGNRFDPNRATSGPMAFFTSDKQVAANYAKGKKDTSLEYDGEDLYEYKNQFKGKLNGWKAMTLDRLWNYLSKDAKEHIAKQAGHIRKDWDGDEDIIFDDNTTNANGGFDWQIKEHRGNILAALMEQWLYSGNLYGEEGNFLKVIELIGLNNYLEEPVKWNDPNYREEKVYDTFIRMGKPFDTDKGYNNDFLDGFEKWWNKQNQKKYNKESMSTDNWDKNDVVVDDWIESAREDVKSNNTDMFTTVPDALTDYLKGLKYDGIIDNGGKYSGLSHKVYIPFYPNQIKSADAVTYDDEGKVIPLSERLNEESEDIRFSVAPSESEENNIIAESMQDEEPIEEQTDKVNVANVAYSVATDIANMQANIPKFRDAGNGNETMTEFFARYNQWRQTMEKLKQADEEAQAEYQRTFNATIPRLPVYESGKMSSVEYLREFAAAREALNNFQLVNDFNGALGENYRAWTAVKRIMWERNASLENWQNRIAKALGVEKLDSKYDTLNAIMRTSSTVSEKVRMYDVHQHQDLMNAVAAISHWASTELDKGRREYVEGSNFEQKVRRPRKVVFTDIINGNKEQWEPGWTWQNVDSDTTPEGNRRNGQLLTPTECIELYLQALDALEAQRLGLPNRGLEGFVNQIGENGKVGGMSAEKVVQEFEQHISKEKCEALQKAVYNATVFAMDEMLRGGLIKPAKYREVMHYNDQTKEFDRKHYVPQRGWAFEAYLDQTMFTDVLKPSAGRVTLANNPLSYIEIIAKSAITGAERNLAKQSLYWLATDKIKELSKEGNALSMTRMYEFTTIDENGNEVTYESNTNIPDEMKAHFIEIYQQQIKPLNQKMGNLKSQLTREQKKLALANKALINNLTQQINDIAEQVKEIRQKEGYIDVISRKEYDNQYRYNPDIDSTVTVFVNGNRYDIHVSQKNVARNINGYYDNEGTDEVIRAWRTVLQSTKMSKWSLDQSTKFFSALKTQFNFVFATSNFARDTSFAYMMNCLEHDPVFATKVLGYSFDSIRCISNYLTGSLDEYAAKKPETAELFREFAENGAITGYSFAQDIPQLRDALKSAIEKAERKMRKEEGKPDTKWKFVQYIFNEVKNTSFGDAVENTAKVAEYLSQLSELMTRFAQYRAVREEQKKKGIDDIPAAINEAKEITTNFNRSGELAPFLGGLWYFANATLQGSYRIIRCGLKHPVKLSICCALWTALGAFMAALQPDDPDEERYIPDYVWKTSIVFPGGIKLPLPHFFRTWFYLGANITWAIKGKKTYGEATLDGMSNLIDDNLPTPFNLLSAIEINKSERAQDSFGIDWEKTRDKYLRGIVPSLAQPFTDLGFNMTFSGAKIYKEPFQDNIDYNDTQLYYKNANRYIIALCNELQLLTGGETNDKHDMGGIKLNPSKLTYLVNSYLSGAPVETMRLAYSIARVGDYMIRRIAGSESPEDMPEWNKMSFVSRFYQPYQQDRMEDAYYWDLKDITDNYSAFLREKKDNSTNSEEAMAIYQKWKDSPNTKLYIEMFGDDILKEKKESSSSDRGRRKSKPKKKSRSGSSKEKPVSPMGAIKEKLDAQEPLTNEEINQLMDWNRRWTEISQDFSEE